jgi:hypothetical protein
MEKWALHEQTKDFPANEYRNVDCLADIVNNSRPIFEL